MRARVDADTAAASSATGACPSSSTRRAVLGPGPHRGPELALRTKAAICPLTARPPDPRPATEPRCPSTAPEAAASPSAAAGAGIADVPAARGVPALRPHGRWVLARVQRRREHAGDPDRRRRRRGPLGRGHRRPLPERPGVPRPRARPGPRRAAPPRRRARARGDHPLRRLDAGAYWPRRGPARTAGRCAGAAPTAPGLGIGRRAPRGGQPTRSDRPARARARGALRARTTPRQAVEARRGLGRATRPRDSRSRPPPAAGGPYWPGGIAAHANGDLHMVFGRWAHRPEPGPRRARLAPAPGRAARTTPSSSSTAASSSRRTATPRPALEPSTVSVLDPETLLPVAPAAAPARAVASRGSPRTASRVIAVGTTTGLPAASSTPAAWPSIDELAARLRPRARARLRLGPGHHRRARAAGWTTGRNHVDRTMLGTRRRARPGAPLVGAPRRPGRGVARSRSAACRSAPSRTRRPGTRTAGVVVAYDAGNAVLRAWRLVGDDARAALAPRRASPTPATSSSTRTPASSWPRTGPTRRPCAARRVRRALRPAFQILAGSAAARRASLPHGPRPARRARPRHGRRQGPRRRPLPEPGLPLPRPGLRPRRLLPVADDDRPGRRHLSSDSASA